MPNREEGAALPPFPVLISLPREHAARPGRAARPAVDGGDPRCEMCGAEVIATHCKRICLRCGFMTGCSEGIG